MDGCGRIPPYCGGKPITIPGGGTGTPSGGIPGGGGGTPCGGIPGGGIPAAIPGGMPGGGIGGGGMPVGTPTNPYRCK